MIFSGHSRANVCQRCAPVVGIVVGRFVRFAR